MAVWMNCVLWLATGAQIMLGVPGEPVEIYGSFGSFRINYGGMGEDGKSTEWAAGEWTRWECEHYVEPQTVTWVYEQPETVLGVDE